MKTYVARLGDAATVCLGEGGLGRKFTEHVAKPQKPNNDHAYKKMRWVLRLRSSNDNKHKPTVKG